MFRRLVGAVVLATLGALLALSASAAAGATTTQCLTQPFNPPIPLNPPNPGVCPPGSPQIVGMAASGLAISGTSTSGPDVIATTSDGAVYSDGTSELGMAGQPLAAPIVGIAP